MKSVKIRKILAVSAKVSRRIRKFQNEVFLANLEKVFAVLRYKEARGRGEFP